MTPPTMADAAFEATLTASLRIRRVRGRARRPPPEGALDALVARLPVDGAPMAHLGYPGRRILLGIDDPGEFTSLGSWSGTSPDGVRFTAHADALSALWKLREATYECWAVARIDGNGGRPWSLARIAGLVGAKPLSRAAVARRERKAYSFDAAERRCIDDLALAAEALDGLAGLLRLTFPVEPGRPPVVSAPGASPLTTACALALMAGCEPREWELVDARTPGHAPPWLSTSWRDVPTVIEGRPWRIHPSAGAWVPGRSRTTSSTFAAAILRPFVRGAVLTTVVRLRKAGAATGIVDAVEREWVARCGA